MRTRGVSTDRRGRGLSALEQLSSRLSICLDTVATDLSVDPMAFWGVAVFVMFNSWRMEIGARSVSLRSKKLTSQAIRE